MDITVAIRDGWALITNTDTGQTAVAVPEVTADRMTFYVKGWHDSYQDAYLVIAAMEALGVSIEDLGQIGDGSATEEAQQTPVAAITAAAPEGQS